jgi:hypothetical protein
LKTQSLNDLKKELLFLPPAELVKIILRLSKYKKENKELLAYLLFDSNYEPEYINRVKEEIGTMFTEINRGTLYFAKKSIRKILRITNKYIRYSGEKRTEVELRIFYCSLLRKSGIPIESSTALRKIFDGQLEKIGKALSTLHEDLQHDYGEEIQLISNRRV